MSSNSERPPFIRNARELDRAPSRYEGLDEVFGERASLSRPLGLERVGVHFDVLEPGQRSSLPHAESLEEEMIYVLSGTPDVWLDGELVRLGPHDVVVFVPGTGIAHTLQNNTTERVEFLAIGERHPDNQWCYPLDPGRLAHTPIGRWWRDRPERPVGDAPGAPVAPSDDG